MSEEIIVSAEQLEQVIEDLINDNNLLQDRIIELEDENKELKEEINKAIEYIEKQSYKCMFELRMDELEELLNILKG